MKAVMIAASLAAAMAATEVQAGSFAFTFTDVISKASIPGIAVGDVFTLTLYASSSFDTVIDQTWNFTDLRHFTTSAGSYQANYFRAYIDPLTNNFRTDAYGNVIQVRFYGSDTPKYNTDNFGVGAAIDGDGKFYNAGADSFNQIQANQFGDASKWTVALISEIPAHKGPLPPIPEPIPEPSTWAMIVLGFGAIGAAMRGGLGRRDRRALG